MAFTRSRHCHRLKWLWLKRISNHFFSSTFFLFVSACHWISCPIYCSSTLKIQGEVRSNLIGDCFFLSPCCWLPGLPSIDASPGCSSPCCVCVCLMVSVCKCVCVNVLTSVFVLTSYTSFKLDTMWLIFGSSEQRQTTRPARQAQCAFPHRYRGSITGVTCAPYWITPGPHLGALHFLLSTATH